MSNSISEVSTPVRTEQRAHSQRTSALDDNQDSPNETRRKPSDDAFRNLLRAQSGLDGPKNRIPWSVETTKQPAKDTGQTDRKKIQQDDDEEPSAGASFTKAGSDDTARGGELAGVGTSNQSLASSLFAQAQSAGVSQADLAALVQSLEAQMIDSVQTLEADGLQGLLVELKGKGTWLEGSSFKVSKTDGGYQLSFNIANDALMEAMRARQAELIRVLSKRFPEAEFKLTFEKIEAEQEVSDTNGEDADSFDLFD